MCVLPAPVASTFALLLKVQQHAAQSVCSFNRHRSAVLPAVCFLLCCLHCLLNQVKRQNKRLWVSPDLSHAFPARPPASLSTQLHRSAVSASICRMVLLLSAMGRQLCLQMGPGNRTHAAPR
jgi:hypothetical protein